MSNACCRASSMIAMAMVVWSSLFLRRRCASALLRRTDRYDAEVSWSIVVNRSSFRTNLIWFLLFVRCCCSEGGGMIFCLCRRLFSLERRCDSSRVVQACCLDASIFVFCSLFGLE